MSEVAGLSEGIEGLRVMIDGSEKFLRLGGDLAKWSIGSILTFAKFLFNIFKKKSGELKPGEMDFAKLFKNSGNNVGLMRIDTEKLEDFIKTAEKSGVSFSIMPDINKADGKTEIAFPQEQAFAVNYFVASNKEFAEVITFDDYFKNADADDLINEMKNAEESITAAKSAKDMGFEGSDSMRDNEVKISVDTFDSSKNYMDIIGTNDYELIKVKSEFLDKAVFAENSEYTLIALPNTREQYVMVSNNRFTGQVEREKTPDKDKGRVLSVDCVFANNETMAVVDKDGKQLIDSNNQPIVINANDLSQRFRDIDMKNKEIADKKEKMKNDLHDGKGNVKYFDKSKTDRVIDKKDNVLSVNFGKDKLKPATPKVNIPTPKPPKSR